MFSPKNVKKRLKRLGCRGGREDAIKKLLERQTRDYVFSFPFAMDLRQLQILCNLPAKEQSLILLFWNLGCPFCWNGDEAIFVTRRVGRKKPPTFTECSWNTVSGSSEAPEVCGNSDKPSTEASWRETDQPPTVPASSHWRPQTWRNTRVDLWVNCRPKL